MRNDVANHNLRDSARDTRFTMRLPPVFKSSSMASEASLVKESQVDLSEDIPLGLTVLHPNGGDDEKSLVDIIAIHGLSGHPKKTWTNNMTDHYWPLKSLPEDIPLSRIMTFGYSTNASPMNSNTAIMSDLAKSLLSHLINKRHTEKQKARPMVFIAHSLGGIVLKEFLHIAYNTGHDDMASCVCGILFLGTPHKGSDLASFLNVLKMVTKSLFHRPPDSIIKDLSRNSRHLLELDQLLRFKLGKVDIYSFYELRPMGSLKKPVVERHSALLNLPSEIEQIGLDADHRQMCKPVDRNDFIYETIAQRIINIMNRQIDREQFSKDLMNMTNNFATRQIEQISLLAKEFRSNHNPAESFSTVFMASFSVKRDTDPTLHPDGLLDVLKDLPLSKVKEYIGGLRVLMKRAESLTEMLRLAERQSEQQKAEAMKTQFEEQQKADKQRIAELMAENSRLREQLRAVTIATGSPTTALSSKKPTNELHIELPSTGKEEGNAIPFPDEGGRNISTSDQDSPIPGPKPASPRIEQIPGSFADDIEFAATLAAGLCNAGFDPNIVIENPNNEQIKSSPGAQGDAFYGSSHAPSDSNTAGPETTPPSVKLSTEADLPPLPSSGSNTHNISPLDRVPKLSDRIPTMEQQESFTSKKAKKKKKKKAKRVHHATEPNHDTLSRVSFEYLDSGADAFQNEADPCVDMEAKNSDKTPESDEEKLVKTRMKSEDILKSLQIALTRGQQMLESLESVDESALSQDSLVSDDGGLVEDSNGDHNQDQEYDEDHDEKDEKEKAGSERKKCK